MKSTTLAPRTRPHTPPIKLGEAERTDADRRYGAWLVWFMRALALIWIAQGLMNWAIVLLGEDGARSPLDTLPPLGAGAVILFAVLDLIAAVGLWLAASWGGVVWLVAVVAQWSACVMLPGFFPFDLAFGLLDLALVGIYFGLTYKAATQIDT